MSRKAWSLPFELDRVTYWAGQYSIDDDIRLDAQLEAAHARGWLEREELIELVRWKASRIVSHARKNSASDVTELTKAALTTDSERLRIEYLRVLHGVDWAVASVILHMLHSDRYPLLDYRAIRALGVSQPSSYSHTFWQKYAAVCREHADHAGVSMRVLDRALWQWDKLNNK